ncbi:hypothetical protein GCM10020220_076550 [Nonomuraea rubra]|uniref:hypothetical protein n=1 Tax=Nonomuraea rubra TaxID=46180 RepID=UPI0031E7A5B3
MRPRVRALLLALTTATASVTVAASPAAAAGATLTVNVAQPFRPVTHAASGGLYGLAENSRPADSTLLPIKPNSLTQPAPGVGQRPNGQPPGGDSLLVAPQATRVGAGQFIRMPDIYPDFPYRWVSWDDWLAKVDTMVRARLNATTVTNVIGWELWNEPDYTWNTAAAGNFNDGWVRTYRAVRALDPQTPIVGPSTAVYNRSWMQAFLIRARDTGTLPDIICWHELQNPARIAADLADYRNLEASLGISPRRISINEYAAPRRGGRARPGGQLRRQVRARRRRVRAPRLLVRVRHHERPGRQQQPADRHVVAVQVVRRHGRQHGHHDAGRPDRPGRLRLL